MKIDVVNARVAGGAGYIWTVTEKGKVVRSGRSWTHSRAKAKAEAWVALSDYLRNLKKRKRSKALRIT